MELKSTTAAGHSTGPVERPASPREIRRVDATESADPDRRHSLQEALNLALAGVPQGGEDSGLVLTSTREAVWQLLHLSHPATALLKPREQLHVPATWQHWVDQEA